MFRKLLKTKCVRIINFQKKKTDKRVRHDNVKLKQTLKEYKQNAEQLLISAVVLWYEKIFSKKVQGNVFGPQGIVQNCF